MTEPLLDFETAMAEQADLDALCAERPYPQREIYWANENYGLASMLKRYSGYPEDDPVCAVIPHGVYLSTDVSAHPGEVAAPVPAVLTYPPYLDNAFRRSTNKRVIPSASPFLYALALADTEGVRATPERAGTMFFPAHSTAMVDVRTPHERAAELLLGLPDEYQPVTVCTYYLDREKGAHTPYAERGMRIVSAGYVSDEQFLIRLIHLLSATRYAASNSLGSNAFYAMAMGIPYFLLDVDVEHVASGGFQQSAPSDKRAAENERLRQMLLELPTEVTPELAEATRYHLGAERFKSPDSLLTDLIYARRLVQGW